MYVYLVFRRVKSAFLPDFGQDSPESTPGQGVGIIGAFRTQRITLSVFCREHDFQFVHADAYPFHTFTAFSFDIIIIGPVAFGYP